jgi:ketosteroid isomerase-like protein
MSNLEIVKRSYRAFGRGDMNAVLADMDEGIEWQQAQGLPHGGIYRGITEVRRNVFDPLDRDWWSEFSAEPDELLDAGDEIVALGRYRGIAKETFRSSTSGRSGTARPGGSASSSTPQAGSRRSPPPGDHFDIRVDMSPVGWFTPLHAFLRGCPRATTNTRDSTSHTVHTHQGGTSE